MELIGHPTTTCIDAARGPEPGLLLGYRLYGRPGARVQKFNRHASCPGATFGEASETAGSVVTIPASGVYSVEIDSADPLPCTFETQGRFEQYAEVDGLRVPQFGVFEQVIYNTGSGCGSALATCTAARTYCP